MARKKTNEFDLTDQEELFVAAFLEDSKFDPIYALSQGYPKSNYRKYAGAMKIMSRPQVRRAIHTRMNESTFWISEGAIIDRLWKEGTEAKTASARVNALVWVGKHLGMWQEKESEESKTIYNIINYATAEDTMVKTIEQEDVSPDKLAPLPEGVAVLSFKEPKEA